MKKVFALSICLIAFYFNLNAQIDLTNGLVAYYPFNGNAQDASGNNLHGIMKNGVSLTSDMNNQPNQAMLFDGVNDYIEILDDPKLRFTNQFSICFIFNRDPSSTIAELIEKRDWSTGSQSSFDIGLVDNAKVRTAIKTGNTCSSPTNGWLYPTVSDPTLPNTWYCVVAIFNNGQLDFYLNGRLVGSNKTAFTSMDNCSGSNVRIGIHLSFDPLPFKGKIDEVRLYNRPLNQAEIGQLCILNNNTCANTVLTGSLTPIPGCENTPAKLEFRSPDTESYTISLKYGNDLIEKTGVVNGQTIELPRKNIYPSTEVELQSMTDKNGCKSVGSKKYNTVVYASPRLQFEGENEFCINDQNTYKVSVKEINSLTSQSSGFSGSNITSEGNFMPSGMSVGENPITYSFISTQGCSASISDVIKIYPAPLANAGNDIIACLNTVIQLNASGGTEYQWNPTNSLSNPSIPNPTVNVTGPMDFELIVTNEFGCTATDRISIKTISDNRSFFSLPNAFTPNGDGKNDCFGIQHWGGVEVKEFSIFNRWGEIIFNTKDPGKCWNGMYKGKRSDPGTYIYKIKASSSCGEIDRKGVVNLLW